MKTYCLSDIWWVYSNDGEVVQPYIFNYTQTKIKDLESGFVYELSEDDKQLSDKVKEIFEKLTNVCSKDLNTQTFCDIQKDQILQFKGLNAIKYNFVKEKNSTKGEHSMDTYYNAALIEVSDKDIDTFSRLIKKGLASRYKKVSKFQNTHNTTSNF